jgi:hypothetical protein
VRRVKELVGWVSSGDYDSIRDGAYIRRGHEPAPSAEFGDAVAHYRARFTSVLERTSGGVQRLFGQFDDWLRGTSTGTSSDD